MEAKENAIKIIKYPDSSMSYVVKKNNIWYYIDDGNYGYSGKVPSKDVSKITAAGRVPKRIEDLSKSFLSEASYQSQINSAKSQKELDDIEGIFMKDKKLTHNQKADFQSAIARRENQLGESVTIT